MPTSPGRLYTAGEVITPKLIPGLPNDIVLTHVLPHLYDPAEMACLCVTSRAMRDYVSEIVLRSAWRRVMHDSVDQPDGEIVDGSKSAWVYPDVVYRILQEEWDATQEACYHVEMEERCAWYRM